MGERPSNPEGDQPSEANQTEGKPIIKYGKERPPIDPADLEVDELILPSDVMFARTEEEKAELQARYDQQQQERAEAARRRIERAARKKPKREYPPIDPNDLLPPD